MKINTALELVRYIRHHLGGSTFQDVKAVEDFVKEKENFIWGELRDLLQLPSTDDDKALVIKELKRLLEYYDNATS